MEPLQRHYQLLHGRYRPLHSGYGAVTSRYGAVTNLTSRYGVGWLQRACALQRHWLRSHASSEGLAPWVVPSALLPQGDSLWLAPSTYVMRQAPRSLCLTTALAPVPTFLGGSCPLGCSLSAPATGGFSVVSPQCSCMRQAPRKRSGPVAHFMGYYSTIVRLLQEGGGITWADGFVVACALLQRMVCFGLRRCPTCPPSNVLGYRGTPPVPPAGAAPPAPCWGERWGRCFVTWRVGMPPGLPRGRRGPPILTFPRAPGQGQRRPGGFGRGGWDRCEARSSAVTARS